MDGVDPATRPPAQKSMSLKYEPASEPLHIPAPLEHGAQDAPGEREIEEREREREREREEREREERERALSRGMCEKRSLMIELDCSTTLLNA